MRSFSKVSFPVFAALAAAGFLAAPAAQAQSTQNFTSTNMWGTAPAGVSVPGAVDSAIAHEHNGTVAAQVNSARKGLLTGGVPGLSITSIGSQSIVSNTVVGNGNSTSVNATQSSSNSGSVSNQGTVNNNKP